ncbi:MAG: hypothetical protein QW751_00340 [Candidatus Aenigmatarchaeota archaeon]|nr:hypothetical protein [Candidatus Aenigmarchaeota archaeon]
MARKQIFGLLFAVLITIFVAGCVGGPFQSLFGQAGEVREAPEDIIVVQNENIVPTPPVLASDEFTVSFEVKNVDDINTVPSVNAELYDWGLCDESKITGWTKLGSKYIQNLGKMGPGQSKPLDVVLVAPSAAQLGNLPGRCPVKYKVNYYFTASTSTSVEVISATRLRALQTAGQAPTYTPTTDIGRGPIKIYMAAVSAMPARTDSTLYISIQVQNKGAGTYLAVPEKKLILKAPDSWTLQDNCGDEFIDAGTEPGYKLYKNKRTIDLVGADKKTFEIRCGFKMPSESDVPETKEYYVFSSLEYRYDLIRELSVDIKP